MERPLSMVYVYIFLYYIFLLTLFETMLKYSYVCQQANINRQQAKMTFQFACRKLQRSKDLEPARRYCPYGLS
jgi:hypothetical protein